VNSFVLRAADLERDRAAILGFIDALQAFEHEFEPNRRLDPLVAEEYFAVMLERAGKHPHRFLLAVDDAGAAIGWGVAFEAEDDIYVLAAERRHIYIAELFVAERARGLGVGRALIAEFEAWAGTLGIAVVQIGVLSGNRRAADVYRRAGYADYAIQLRKYLR
jgi:GNAT superfamily N-acetyltransferase